MGVEGGVISPPSGPGHGLEMGVPESCSRGLHPQQQAALARDGDGPTGLGTWTGDQRSVGRRRPPGGGGSRGPSGRGKGVTKMEGRPTEQKKGKEWGGRDAPGHSLPDGAVPVHSRPQ